MIKKYRFTLSTRFVGSDVEEIMELEFDDDATEEEIEDVVGEVYTEWLNENNYGGYREIE